MKTLASYRPLSTAASLHIVPGGAIMACAALLAIALAANSANALQPPMAANLAEAKSTDEDTAEEKTGDALDKALKAIPEVTSETEPEINQSGSEPEPKPVPHMEPPKGAKRLSKTGRAWIDKQQGVVYVDGRISLRRGLLEMFACPPNTKEHESIVSVESEAFVLHAGLLAIGAETGAPVQFSPEYKPPTGTEIQIEVLWKDAEGKQQKVEAQYWVRDARTKKQMELPWVFAGSGFWHNEETGGSGYLAEEGDLVCLANFSTAMLDVPAQATNSNAGLLFEAFTERVPPLGWPVRLVFKPILKQSESADAVTESPAKPPTAEDSQSVPRE